MLTGQHQALVDAAQVEVRVAEGMQVARTAQPLTGGHSAGGVLARVMHQDHREVQLPLQQAEVGQQFGHFPGVVFIHAMQPDQRIQQQQAGPQPPGGLQQSLTVRFTVQPQRRGP